MKIEGECEAILIAEKFSQRFKGIFDDEKCQNISNLEYQYLTTKLNANVRKGQLLGNININDVCKGINDLKHVIGYDNVHSNHIKHGSEYLVKLLAKLFSSFVTHGYLPERMTFGVILPLVKDKFKDQSDIENYRPIVSSSVFLKLFEYCLKYHIERYVTFNDRQHGFRVNHSTSTACLVLKETILRYNSLSSNVYASFIDLKKAFDKVNHFKLIHKLLKLNIPIFYVNILYFLYRNQSVATKHKDAVSDPWKIKNGVRQGGILSTVLFNIYINDMIEKVSESSTGCKLGNRSSNIIAYADDLVLLSPSSSGLQELLNIIENEAKAIDIEINPSKSVCMYFKHKHDNVKDPILYLYESKLEVVHECRYLGFVIDCNLHNDKDIIRCRNKFYNEFNCLLRKFSSVSCNVFSKLFQSYCMSFYGSELWFCNKKCYVPLKQFAIGFHKAIKKMMKLRYWESNHKACHLAGLMTFNHFINWQRIRFSYKIISNPCKYLRKCLLNVSEDLFLANEAKSVLLSEYNIESMMENDIDAIKSRILYVQNNEPTLR